MTARLSERQKSFNKVWKYFVKDENPRAVEKKYCMLETENGQMCALGVLMTKAERDSIPDGTDEVESRDWIYKLSRLGHLPVRFANDIEFYANLVDMHDNPRFGRIKERPGLLRRVAKRWGLNTPS